MKKRYMLSGLMLSSLYISCSDSCHDVGATFTNSSGKDVTAYSFKRPYQEKPYLFKETKINNNSSISNTWKSCLPAPVLNDFYMLLEGDSIVIDFGDRTKCFKGSEWNHFSLQKPSNPNVYILTPQDYTDATPKP